MNVKPVTSSSRRLPRPYRHSKTAGEDERTAEKPSDTSFAALLATGRAQLTEGFWNVVDYSSRTFYYLQAAREYEEAVRNDPNTIAYPGTRIAYPGARKLEIEVIAVQAGLRYEDVPNLALKLEGTVRQLERLKSVISMIFWIYTLQYPWGRLLVGFWRQKLTLGFAFIIWRCVNAGTGKRWPAVCFVAKSLLVGPICALLHIAILWLGYV